MSVGVTEHFLKRFGQRIAKSKRAYIFANRAYSLGKPVNDFKNATFAKEIKKKEEQYGSTARVYSNCVYWYYDGKAVTVYQLPQNLHGRL